MIQEEMEIMHMCCHSVPHVHLKGFPGCDLCKLLNIIGTGTCNCIHFNILFWRMILSISSISATNT